MLAIPGKYAQAQYREHPIRYYFNHITTENGLSDNSITALYRDRRGFLWIGTHNGLNKYDGRNVTTFRHDRFHPHSIASNVIHNIVEGDSGYLWLSTNVGVSRFNPFDHEFVNYRHDVKDSFSLNDNYNCHVYFDRKGTLWVGNESGLSYFDKKTSRFIPVTILPDALNRRTLTAVSSLLEDREGRFWLGTYSGLVLYDRAKQTFQRFILNRDFNGKNAVTSLFQDHAGHIWVGFWGSGLSEFNPETNTFHPFRWNTKSRYASAVNIVFSMTETHPAPGRYILWAGTSEGLLKIDSLPLSANTITHIVPDPSDPHSINSKDIACLLTDDQNILWTGGENGLNEYLARNQFFTSSFSIKGNVTKIWADTIHKSLHYFITAWYGNGLTEMDTRFHRLHTWKRIPADAKETDNGQASAVLRTRDGSLWVGTFNGLYRYDEKRHRFTGYPHQEGQPNALTDNHITTLQEDDEGGLWIGTYGHGVDRYDLSKKTFAHFHHTANPNSLVNDLVWNIYKDRYGRIWVATDKGLSMFDKTTRRFINYTDQENDPNTLKGNIVSGLVAEANDICWISTEKGLNQLDLRHHKFTLYASEEGLKDNNITALTSDHRGRLWMCTGNGISSFDPATRTFVNYDEQNGLPKGISGPMETESDGSILAGGDELLLKFDPSSFSFSSSPPPVYISQIAIGGRPLILHRPAEQVTPLVLHYPRNTFSATFSAPEFFNGKDVKYAYRLEGADAQWIAAGSQNFVTYSSLAPARYTLHVKAAGSDGIWNEKGTSLEIIVLPPFWQTGWFRISALLLIILIIYSLFTYRVMSIRREEALKTSLNKQMADLRLKVLRTRMNPHFMFNALNSIQECIYTRQTDTASRYLAKFSRLVRLILEKSENTFITISEEIELLRLYLEVESLRFEKNFSYHIQEKNIESDLLKIPPMLVQPFVENALWHGLRHKEGEKKLSISFRSDHSFIYVTIEDNGIGRQKALAFKTDHGEKKQSLGIKLSREQLEMVSALSRQQADVNIEDIYDDTGEPAGTKVTMSIPIVTS